MSDSAGAMHPWATYYAACNISPFSIHFGYSNSLLVGIRVSRLLYG